MYREFSPYLYLTLFFFQSILCAHYETSNYSETASNLSKKLSTSNRHCRMKDVLSAAAFFCLLFATSALSLWPHPAELQYGSRSASINTRAFEWRVTVHGEAQEDKKEEIITLIKVRGNEALKKIQYKARYKSSNTNTEGILCQHIFQSFG